MKLWEIDERIMQAVLEAVDQETGEVVSEEALERLDQLQMERQKKVEGVILWIKNLESEAEAIKNEERSLAERRKAKERKIESLKKFIDYSLAGQEFETAKTKVSYRRSEAVEIEEGMTVPVKYMRVKKEPDKTLIKKALKEGIKVRGASLVERFNMVIK